ncbi:ABC transporter ATP-binding protein [Bacteroidota bacterium]
MKKLGRIFRYIIPYKTFVGLHILFTAFSVVFSLFSIAMAIPFLNILFGLEEMVYTAPEFALNIESVKLNIYYFLTNIIIDYGKAEALAAICVIFTVMTFFKTSFIYLAMYFLAPIRNGVVKDLRNDLYEKIVALPLAYYSEEKKGDIIARASNDVQEIEWSILSALEAVFRSPIQIIAYIIALLIMSVELTIFALILLPIAGYIIGLLGRTLRKTSADAQSRMGHILSIIEETLSGLRIVKAFNAEDKILSNFLTKNQFYTNVMNKIYRRRYLATPLTEFLATIVVGATMWYGGSLVIGGEAVIQPSVLLTYLLVFSQVIPPAKSFSTASYNVQKGLASVDRIEEVLNADIRITEIQNPKLITGFNSEIEYRNVTFRYNTTDVLKNINLKIEKGKTVALVGQSGSGKTTMVDLLPRFYDTVEGEILIDGLPVKECRIKDVRHLMGNVNQEPILFNDTIHNNISFGVDNAKEEDVILAAKVANAHEFIMETGEGYQTNIGDRGSKLSGGQRQRLSIARAVLKNPPILILDEATSSLDSESERLVQDALEKLMENRTSIVIAHRLSTVRNADEICVLHEGEIVERGTHDELLEIKGIYKKLHDLDSFS